MRNSRCCLSIACLGFFLSALPAAAQSLCRPTETVRACWDRLAGEISGDAAKTEAVKAQTDVAKKTETGLEDINGLSSSVKDFLPLLQLTGVLGAVQKDDTSGTVSIALNTRFLGASGRLTEDPSLQLKAVVETTPKLFGQLKDKLPAENHETLEKALLNGKTNAENVTLHASYSFTSRRLGRNFAQHSALLNDLFEEAVAGPTSTRVIQRADLERKLIQGLGAQVSLETTPWNTIPETNRIAAEKVLLEAVKSDLALNAAFAAAVKDPGISLFGQLVNNQPQLSITGYRTFRDDLFGPDLLSGRISFEMGLGNSLNGFFDQFDPRQCRKQRAECLAEYSAFVKDPDTKANIKAGSRLAVYAEFTQNEDYHFTNPDAGLDLAIERATSFSAGLDYGRLLGISDAGAADGRVDASIRYERPSDDAGESRFVTSLTIIKKLGDISIPFGVVYANKPRFLTGVDHGLTANVGLKFNLFPGLN